MGLSREEFDRAVTACGYPHPPSDVAGYLSNATSGFSRGELAMFLAQLIHESGGFQHIEEISPPPGHYNDGRGYPGKSYHGRGYIQLTWGANYAAASQALFSDDRLLRDPDSVARDRKLAVQVSVWYWTAVVRPAIRGRENCFGATTKAINGALECSGAYHPAARQRYDKYIKVAEALRIPNLASEAGCYN